MLAVAAVVAAGGCSLAETCGPFGDPLPFADAAVEAVGAPSADTLTVLFVADGLGEFGSYDAAPDRAAGDALRLTVEGETSEMDAPPRFETAVRGDTVFVRTVRTLFRAACSPAQGESYRVARVEAPAGVRVVRFRTVWYADVPFPVAAPAVREPLFFTV